MSAEIKDLSPKHVWGYFYDLTQIPRPTGHMEAVTRFMISFGKGLGLETLQDEVGNVLIRKPATPGMEGRKTVTLQSHLDMVPQKNSSVKHDFEKDPIDAYIDGDWVTARETTLGADNGMGAALAMAVLADNSLRHGPIEALFTIDEEQGMDGAFGLKPHFLQGDILLNCDSEKEGELFVGCAGGANVNVSFQFKEDTYIPEGDVAVKVSLSGLKGGHSGVDIHCVDLPQLNTLTLGIYATLAQHERELIGQRTKAALQAKKARGVKLGSPKATFTDTMRINAIEAIQEKARSNENTIRAVEAIRMILQETKNLSHIAAYLNEKRFQTAKGKSFQPVQVKRLIEKYGLE